MSDEQKQEQGVVKYQPNEVPDFYRTENVAMAKKFNEDFPAKLPRYKVNQKTGKIVDARGIERGRIRAIFFPTWNISRVLFNEKMGNKPIWYCRNPKIPGSQILNERELSENKLQELTEAGCGRKCCPKISYAYSPRLSAEEAIEKGYCPLTFWSGDDKPKCTEIYNFLCWDVDLKAPFIIQFARTAITPMQDKVNANFHLTGICISSAFIDIVAQFIDNGTFQWYIPAMEIQDGFVPQEEFLRIIQRMKSLEGLFRDFIEAEPEEPEEYESANDGAYEPQYTIDTETYED